MQVKPEQALDGVRLVMLANDVSLRHLIPDELAKGFGFFQGKPATAFSPVAVTVDELGDAWQGGRVHLSMQVSWSKPFLYEDFIAAKKKISETVAETPEKSRA
jgi:fumarylacetoacetate (FAA) hydrolase